MSALKTLYKYRKDSLISKLPKDVFKLLCDKYISPKKEQRWITNKRKTQIKYKMYIFIIIVLFIIYILCCMSFLTPKYEPF